MLRAPNGKPEIVGLLDIGTSKVVAAIIQRSWPVGTSAPPVVEVLGVGQCRSQGIKAGTIVHLDQAEAAVRMAVGQAERQADVTLEDVVATISCGRLKSRHMTTHVDLDSGAVRPEDINRLGHAAQSFAVRDGRVLVHLNRMAYVLDGQGGMRNPCNLAGRRLSATWHAVVTDRTPHENLRRLIEHSYLGVRQFVPSGLAAAMAATTAEERQLGITCVNIGAGVIDIAAFRDGQFLQTHTIPVGGAHLTYDLARIFSMPLAEAERIKTLYGTLVAARSDERELITYRLASRIAGGSAGEHGGESYETSRAEIHRALLPRVESQLRLVRERIEQDSLGAEVGRNVVLTGGASQMVGLVDLAAVMLDRPVRLGGSLVVAGLPEQLQTPAFSGVMGLAHVAPGLVQQVPAGGMQRVLSGGYLDRMERWLRESF